jgi:hypothetical protein
VKSLIAWFNRVFRGRIYVTAIDYGSKDDLSCELHGYWKNGCLTITKQINWKTIHPRGEKENE